MNIKRREFIQRLLLALGLAPLATKALATEPTATGEPSFDELKKSVRFISPFELNCSHNETPEHPSKMELVGEYTNRAGRPLSRLDLADRPYHEHTIQDLQSKMPNRKEPSSWSSKMQCLDAKLMRRPYPFLIRQIITFWCAASDVDKIKDEVARQFKIQANHPDMVKCEITVTQPMALNKSGSKEYDDTFAYMQREYWNADKAMTAVDSAIYTSIYQVWPSVGWSGLYFAGPVEFVGKFPIAKRPWDKA